MNKHLALLLTLAGALWMWHPRLLTAGDAPGALHYNTQTSAVGRLEIVRRPGPADFGRGRLAELPHYNPKSTNPWQMDLRGTDVGQLKLTDRLSDLLQATFDSRTRWPEILPPGFDPKEVLDRGRDPGLGVRQLHARGITGKGIAVGVIDQTLLTDHAEYRDRLRLYEEIHAPEGIPSEMHGPAVASLAVGKTVGVAPEADLYYIAETHGTFHANRQFEWDFTYLAQSIHRLLDVNATLSPSARIRVISISVGWSPGQKGYEEAMAAIQRSDREGVFVVSTALEQTHHLGFHGLGRPPGADPNDPNACLPGSWWAQPFWDGTRRFAPDRRLLVPMDCRTAASPTGVKDYVYYSTGGWSWSVPWIAGLYALGCQVKPDLTPAVFWAEAMKTGRTIHLQHEGSELELGTIADPVALVASLILQAPSAP